MSFEEFRNYYKEKGKLPNDITVRAKPLNEKQLLSRYRAYQKAIQKRELAKERNAQEPEEWTEVKRRVLERDRYTCRLYPLLTFNELKEVDVNPHFVDPAHIYPKSVFPHLKYDEDNIIALNRTFHSRLDQYKSPVTGNPISLEERYAWFQRIIGSKKYYELERKSREKE